MCGMPPTDDYSELRHVLLAIGIVHCAFWIAVATVLSWAVFG